MLCKKFKPRENDKIFGADKNVAFQGERLTGWLIVALSNSRHILDSTGIARLAGAVPLGQINFGVSCSDPTVKCLKSFRNTRHPELVSGSYQHRMRKNSFSKLFEKSCLELFEGLEKCDCPAPYGLKPITNSLNQKLSHWAYFSAVCL